MTFVIKAICGSFSNFTRKQADSKKGLFAVTVYSGKQIEGGFDFIWDKVRALQTHIIVRSPIDILDYTMKSHDKAVESGRAEFFVSSWDPTVRNSLQAVILGNFFGLNAYSFCYGMITPFLQTYSRYPRPVLLYCNVSRLISSSPIRDTQNRQQVI